MRGTSVFVQSIFVVHVCFELGRKSEGRFYYDVALRHNPHPSKSSMQIQSDLSNNPQHLKAGFLQTIYDTTLVVRVHFIGYFRVIIDPNRDQFRGKVGTKIDARTIIEAGPF